VRKIAVAIAFAGAVAAASLAWAGALIIATGPVIVGGGAGPIIPADRNFLWNPGMTSQGGIPTRTTICATLSPIGGGADDSAAIQSAVNGCAAGQVVKLNAGNFVVNNNILITTGITLRGSNVRAGDGITTLTKVNGAHGRYPTNFTGSTVIKTPEPPGSTGSYTGKIDNGSGGAGTILTLTAVAAGALNVGDVLSGAGVTGGTKVTAFGTATGGLGTYTITPSQLVAATNTLASTYPTIDPQAIITVGPSIFPGVDNSTAQALTVNGVQGATSVTVANGSGFAAGQFVLLDELSNAFFQAAPVNFPTSDSSTNASFTGSIAGSTLTAGTPSSTGTSSPGFSFPGDTLSAGSNPTTIVAQLTGTTGGAGTYSVTPGGQSVGSGTITSGGPAPPLVWKGDRVAWNIHWPTQVFQDDSIYSNSTDVFQAVSPRFRRGGT
jgi:hypothetical protein